MKYSAPKGMEDILPPDIYIWQRIEATAKEVFSLYGFQEIRVPIVESTDIFTRSIGEATDIVEKEMYTFLDKGGRSLTLRPEGTASAVRCYVENNLHTLPSPQKFYYTGPMFRYERPQKGRQRQFFQIGVEAFGVQQPSLDAEIIIMLKRFLERIGLKELSFELNSIGCNKCRPEYKDSLLNFFKAKLPDFCADCQRRYLTNPLRILDCKVPGCIELRQGAPTVTDNLCEECNVHFNSLTSRLHAMDVPYVLNPNLVRGLDYYTRTAFEVTTEHLGAQKAVAAGGRYDGLVHEFGGPQTPAIGFAVGIERLVALIKAQEAVLQSQSPKVFIAMLGSDAALEGARIAEVLRSGGYWAEPDYSAGSLKSQLRRADRIGADFAFIIGDDELKAAKIKWKNLKNGTQGEIEIKDALTFIADYRQVS